MAKLFLSYSRKDETKTRRFTGYQLLEDPQFQPFVEKDALFGPNFAAVRADLRFMVIAARLGLVRYWRETDFWRSAQLSYDCKAEAAKYRD